MSIESLDDTDNAYIDGMVKMVLSTGSGYAARFVERYLLKHQIIDPDAVRFKAALEYALKKSNTETARHLNDMGKIIIVLMQTDNFYRIFMRDLCLEYVRLLHGQTKNLL